MAFLARGRSSGGCEHRPLFPIAHGLTGGEAGQGGRAGATEPEQRDSIHHAQRSHGDLSGLQLYRSIKHPSEAQER